MYDLSILLLRSIGVNGSWKYELLSVNVAPAVANPAVLFVAVGRRETH